jgi:hypothetical protein
MAPSIIATKSTVAKKSFGKAPAKSETGPKYFGTKPDASAPKKIKTDQSGGGSADQAEKDKPDREAQKLLKLQRKAQKTPMASLIIELKQIWEKLRLKHIPKAERQQIIAQTIPMVAGHLNDVC